MTRTTKNITKDLFVGQPKLFSDQILPSNNFFKATSVPSTWAASSEQTLASTRRLILFQIGRFVDFLT